MQRDFGWGGGNYESSIMKGEESAALKGGATMTPHPVPPCGTRPPFHLEEGFTIKHPNSGGG